MVTCPEYASVLGLERQTCMHSLQQLVLSEAAPIFLSRKLCRRQSFILEYDTYITVSWCTDETATNDTRALDSALREKYTVSKI